MEIFRPPFKGCDISDIVERHFGLEVVVEKQLESYDDQNFLVHTNTKLQHAESALDVCQHSFIFKILNALDSKRPDIIDAQTKMIVHLSNKGYPTPAPVLSINKRYLETCCVDGTQYNIRLFRFMPGTTLDKISLTTSLCYDIGLFAGKMDSILQTCSISGDVAKSMRRKWNLTEVPCLRQHIHVMEDLEQQNMILEVIDQFESKILSHSSSFSQGLIHSDFNDCNILVDRRQPAAICLPHESNNNEDMSKTDEYHVCGVIDFGDATKSLYIFEVAIAMAYVMINKHDINPMDAARQILQGYLQHMKLPEQELKYLRVSVCARMVQSLVLGQVSFLQEPDNEYILIHAKRIWPVLKMLWQKSDTEMLSEIYN